MKRILVVDDERPVVEAVELMVRRDLAGEFTVVGDASSGRDAVEKALALAPDIVLMDVWMPGISGLDAVREIRSRGLSCVFILVTAYERFDIAREAMELGVLDYLLKPVARDKLAAALRAAAEFADRRFGIERREMEHREREERLGSFVEESFLRAVMTDGDDRFDAERYRTVLGLPESFAVVAAASFLPRPGAPDPEAEVRTLQDAFRSAVRYKTRAMAGPPVSGFCAVLIPLSAPEDAGRETEAFRSVLEQTQGKELARGQLRMGYAPAVPIGEANRAWSRAFRESLAAGERESGREDARGGAGSGSGWEDALSFVSALAAGDPGRARVALERALDSLSDAARAAPEDRYRVASLFLQACQELERRGFLGKEEARGRMDMDDIRSARNVPALAAAARVRFDLLAEAARRVPRWSGPVGAAMEYIRGNYSRPISLITAADEVSLSPNRLSRVLVEETGRGFSDLLIEVRIGRAKELLSRHGASIKEVSAACGYTDANYFSRLFKRVTGLTPSAFYSVSTGGADAEP